MCNILKNRALPLPLLLPRLLLSLAHEERREVSLRVGLILVRLEGCAEGRCSSGGVAVLLQELHAAVAERRAQVLHEALAVGQRRERRTVRRHGALEAMLRLQRVALESVQGKKERERRKKEKRGDERERKIGAFFLDY